MLGSEDPEQLQGRLTDDGTDTEDVPESPEDQGEHGDEATKAMAAAMKTELRAWRRAALNDLKKMRVPSDRAFVTAIMPDHIARKVRLDLAMAGMDEVAVKAVFTDITGLLDEQAASAEVAIKENDNGL